MKHVLAIVLVAGACRLAVWPEGNAVTTVLALVLLAGANWLAVWPHLQRPTNWRITFEGKCWLAIAGCLLAVGWIKGMNLILLTSYMMIILWVLNFIVAGRGLPGIKARRWIEGPVFAGTPFSVRVEVVNTSPRTVPGICWDAGTKETKIAGFEVSLEGGQRVMHGQAVSLPRRGMAWWGPVTVSSGYPFGLIDRRRAFGPEDSFPVFPQLGQVHRGRLRHYLRSFTAVSGLVRARRRPQPLVPTEFHGVRPFRPGDSPKWVHWRTTARRGELMVREFEDGQTENLVLVVEPWLPTGQEDPSGDPLKKGTGTASSPALGAQSGDRGASPLFHLEDIISLAATICWEWCRQPGDQLVLAVAGFGPVVLHGTTGRDLVLGLLEALAVQPGSSVTNIDPLVERLAELRLPSGPVLVVTTRPDRDLADSLAARLHRPVGCVNAASIDRHDFYERPPFAVPPPGGLANEAGHCDDRRLKAELRT